MCIIMGGCLALMPYPDSHWLISGQFITTHKEQTPQSLICFGLVLFFFTTSFLFLAVGTAAGFFDYSAEHMDYGCLSSIPDLPDVS